MMWRFWRELPPKGRIGVFLGSWYTWPILNRVAGHTKIADLDQSLERARRLETMLTAEGADPQVLDASIQGEAKNALNFSKKTRKPAGASPNATGSITSGTINFKP